MASSFRSVFEGFLIMVISIVIGFLMSYIGGLIIDTTVTSYEQAGLWIVAPEWDPRSGIGFLMNIYALLMYTIPIMGILVFLVTVFHRQRYDRYV